MSINIKKNDGRIQHNFEMDNIGEPISIKRNSNDKPRVNTPEIDGLEYLLDDNSTTSSIKENDNEGEDDGNENEVDDTFDERYASNFEESRESTLSYEEIKQKKAFALYMLERFKKQGRVLSSHFGQSHSLEELELEIARIENEKNFDNVISVANAGLQISVNVLETANSIYGRNIIKLNGWGAFVTEECSKSIYDDALLKIYQLYFSENANLHPVLALCLLLGSSAYNFHRQQSALSYKQPQQETTASRPQMKEPSTDIDALMENLSTDTESVVSSNYTRDEDDTIITIVPKKTKKRGRPKKTQI